MTTQGLDRLTPLVLTDEQVAELLQVSKDCVTNLHRTRQLCGLKIGRHLRWRPRDVENFVAELDNGKG